MISWCRRDPTPYLTSMSPCIFRISICCDRYLCFLESKFLHFHFDTNIYETVIVIFHLYCEMGKWILWRFDEFPRIPHKDTSFIVWLLNNSTCTWPICVNAWLHAAVTRLCTKSTGWRWVREPQLWFLGGNPWAISQMLKTSAGFWSLSLPNRFSDYTKRWAMPSLKDVTLWSGQVHLSSF